MRKHLLELLTWLSALSTTYMLYATLRLASNTSQPVLAVISESMAPIFHRGDLIFLWNRTQHINAGDVPVMWFDSSPLPMVHRAVEVHTSHTGEQLILTRGDNNQRDDRIFYPNNRDYVYRREIVGLVKGYVPWVGYFTIGLKGGIRSWLTSARHGVFG